MQPELHKLQKQEYSYTGSLPQALSEAESLVHDMQQLLCREAPLHSEGKLCSEVKMLERWLHDCRHGSGIEKITTRGGELINDIKDRLKLAVEEIQRLEGEGGNPASPSQAAEVESLVAALRRLEQIIPVLEEKLLVPGVI